LEIWYLCYSFLIIQKCMYTDTNTHTYHGHTRRRAYMQPTEYVLSLSHTCVCGCACICASVYIQLSFFRSDDAVSRPSLVYSLRQLARTRAHAHESCHTSGRIMSHTLLSHVTHMTESCHTHECIMSHA